MIFSFSHEFYGFLHMRCTVRFLTGLRSFLVKTGWVPVVFGHISGLDMFLDVVLPRF